MSTSHYLTMLDTDYFQGPQFYKTPTQSKQIAAHRMVRPENVSDPFLRIQVPLRPVAASPQCGAIAMCFRGEPPALFLHDVAIDNVRVLLKAQPEAGGLRCAFDKSSRHPRRLTLLTTQEVRKFLFQEELLIRMTRPVRLVLR